MRTRACGRGEGVRRGAPTDLNAISPRESDLAWRPSNEPSARLEPRPARGARPCSSRLRGAARGGAARAPPLPRAAARRRLTQHTTRVSKRVAAPPTHAPSTLLRKPLDGGRREATVKQATTPCASSGASSLTHAFTASQEVRRTTSVCCTAAAGAPCSLSFTLTTSHPRLWPEAASVVFIASKRTPVGTQTGGYLYLATSRTRKRSPAASYAANGDMCPPPRCSSAVRK